MTWGRVVARGGPQLPARPVEEPDPEPAPEPAPEAAPEALQAVGPEQQTQQESEAVALGLAVPEELLEERLLQLAQDMLASLDLKEYRTSGNVGVELHLKERFSIGDRVVPVAIHCRAVVMTNPRGGRTNT